MPLFDLNRIKGRYQSLRARGDTVVIVDTGYDMWSTFGQPDDVILSPFDPAFPGWLPMNEIRSPADWSALVQSLSAGSSACSYQYGS